MSEALKIRKALEIANATRAKNLAEQFIKQLNYHFQQEKIALSVFETMEIPPMLQKLSDGLIGFWDYFFSKALQLQNPAALEFIAGTMQKNQGVYVKTENMFYGLLMFYLKELMYAVAKENKPKVE